MRSVRVSCVIPAYNAEPHIAQAVRSVLEQTRVPDEVIVVDDGSTDGTAEVLAGFGDRIRLVSQAQGGAAAARNAGVAAADGQWIALLDADDWWLPEKVERTLDALSHAPEAAIAYTGRLVCDDRTGQQRQAPLVRQQGHAYHGLLAGNCMPTSSAMVQHEAWDRAGGMASDLMTCEDWDLWLRVAREEPVVCVPEPLCVYRLHVGGISQSGVSRMREDEQRVLQRRIEADPDLPERVVRQAWSAHHFRCGMDAYSAADFRGARARFRQALGQAWHRGAAWRYLLTLLGPSRRRTGSPDPG